MSPIQPWNKNLPNILATNDQSKKFVERGEFKDLKRQVLEIAEMMKKNMSQHPTTGPD